jgi:hypothetical protein
MSTTVVIPLQKIILEFGGCAKVTANTSRLHQLWLLLLMINKDIIDVMTGVDRCSD